MADRHISTKGAEFGVRAAERLVDAICSVAAWLREEHHIPSEAGRAPARWRRALKEERGSELVNNERDHVDHATLLMNTDASLLR